MSTHHFSSCCSAHPALREIVAPAIASSGSQISPAHHASEQITRDYADTIVVGRIATGNPQAPHAEAMAISGGTIIGLGTLSEVENLVNASTQILKPDGVVIPGLIEPHMHIWTSLLTLSWLDISQEKCATFDDVVIAIKNQAQKTPAGQFVLGKLFDPSLYPGEPNLTLEILDQVAPDNPVLVMNASMHYLYANSLAFSSAGVSYNTADPAGGTFQRADGKLTGVIGEAPAMMMMLGAMPKPSQQEVATGIRSILSACAAQGVTSVREAATGTIAGVGEFALLHQLNSAERLPTRVSTAQFTIMPGKETPAAVAAAWKEAGVTPFSGDEMVRADAWKVVTDGSNQGRSGYFSQPYLGEDNGGHANWTPETLRGALKAGLDDGWQIMIHTNGDAAVEMALEAMEELLPSYEQTDLRHRFEHASFTSDDQLTRMAGAGISPSFLMNHVYFWGAAFRDSILGPERTEHLDRVATAYSVGLRPSLHSDFNVTKVHPLLSAQTAVLRKTQADGTVINPAECATKEQALAAITSIAAWQIHADDRGTLEVGKRADYAVVDADPWNIDPESWDTVSVSQTHIGGILAFQL